MNFDISILRCPLTNNNLVEIKKQEFGQLNISNEFEHYGKIDGGLIDESHFYFYPVFDEICILLPQYAIYIGNDKDLRGNMSFDRKRVFDYYNNIDYQTKNSLELYKDSQKWVDFRDVTKAYLQNSFTKAAKFYAPTGKYLLDIASGPIGLPEYINLSAGY